MPQEFDQNFISVAREIIMIIKLLKDILSVKFILLYVIVMSRTPFRVNPHFIFPRMSRNSLLETSAISEVEVTATGLQPKTT